MTPSDRAILERAVAAISEQAANASKVIDEAMDAGLPADYPVTIAAKMFRLQLLNTKAELELGLAEFSLTCADCGRNVHWVSGLGDAAGHWSHAEPACRTGCVTLSAVLIDLAEDKPALGCWRLSPQMNGTSLATNRSTAGTMISVRPIAAYIAS
jgi:hypothetical protein